MHEAYKRILQALSEVGHLTTSQLTHIVYPGEGVQAYWRISKNLKQLAKDNLVKSKAYGLTKEKGTIEHLWSIKQSEISKELKLKVPRKDIHRYKYDHQVLIGDICALLYAVAENIGRHKLTPNLIPDLEFNLNSFYYLEAEMGNHKPDELRAKIEKYKRYFRETRKSFTVLFVMAFDEDMWIAEKALEGQPHAYEAVSFNQLKSSISSSYTVSYLKEQGRILKPINA